MDGSSRKYTLIGGHAHGTEITVADSIDRLEVPVYSDDNKEKASEYNETYTRRRLDPERFGADAECFGISTDDDTAIDCLMSLQLKGEHKARSSRRAARGQ